MSSKFLTGRVLLLTLTLGLLPFSINAPIGLRLRDNPTNITDRSIAGLEVNLVGKN
jgi:hypothetical protein